MFNNVIVICRVWQILEGNVNENGKVDVAPLNVGQARKLLYSKHFALHKL
jgi:hypothetical protein